MSPHHSHPTNGVRPSDSNIGYDRLGLYVNIVYNVKEKTLSATDVDTRESITLKGCPV